MTAVDQLGIANSDGKLPLNILKVQHHGSDRNTTRSFFEKFPAKRYILSGDGEHGNPERDTFVFMAAALNGSPAVVELTYSPEEIDRGRAADRAKHGSSQFDSEVDGIAALLVAHPNFTLQFPR